MSFNKIYSLALLCIILLASHVHAADTAPAAEEVARQLQAVYDRMHGFQADFTQETASTLYRRRLRAAGKVIFVKPGLMRWDYLNPDYQVLISNGETITMYFEKNRQMIVTTAKHFLQSDLVYSFFAGTGNILRDFDIFPVTTNTFSPETTHVIKLVPKEPHAKMKDLYVWVNKDDFFIKKISITEHFDTVTDFEFSDTEQLSDKQVDPAVFEFTPPVGTEIIKND
jgi:outer membrane lipoprotein carrier protein